jgi:hypothetical protein
LFASWKASSKHDCDVEGTVNILTVMWFKPIRVEGMGRGEEGAPSWCTGNFFYF